MTDNKPYLSTGTTWIKSRVLGIKTAYGTRISNGLPGELVFSGSGWMHATISDILALIRAIGYTGGFDADRTELEVANSRISSLRDALEDIRSLRRINSIGDVQCECDFYLTRDDEESGG